MAGVSSRDLPAQDSVKFDHGTTSSVRLNNQKHFPPYSYFYVPSDLDRVKSKRCRKCALVKSGVYVEKN
ncbi:hypothetical protein HNY73_004182 [Argiope bruennichi]|uniref:Uncharacterized protein n=1 Tax=Argiope bruennichi TaxID=94029 RepID=A0A8T0FR00_ARGBR|nr:hypothetical protein HNY73_004182 [Argiope bruennichi]